MGFVFFCLCCLFNVIAQSARSFGFSKITDFRLDAADDEEPTVTSATPASEAVISEKGAQELDAEDNDVEVADDSKESKGETTQDDKVEEAFEETLADSEESGDEETQESDAEEAVEEASEEPNAEEDAKEVPEDTEDPEDEETQASDAEEAVEEASEEPNAAEDTDDTEDEKPEDTEDIQDTEDVTEEPTTSMSPQDESREAEATAAPQDEAPEKLPAEPLTESPAEPTTTSSATSFPTTTTTTTTHHFLNKAEFKDLLNLNKSEVWDLEEHYEDELKDEKKILNARKTEYVNERKARHEDWKRIQALFEERRKPYRALRHEVHRLKKQEHLMKKELRELRRIAHRKR